MYPASCVSSVKYTAPSKPRSFSTSPGSIARASAVPSDPVTKSFCTSTTTNALMRVFLSTCAAPYLHELDKCRRADYNKNVETQTVATNIKLTGWRAQLSKP